MFKLAARYSVLTLLGLCVAFAQGNSNGNASEKAVHETLPRNAAGGGSSSTSMGYHGGPLMVNGVNVYYIWYGNWSGNTAADPDGTSLGILHHFALNIGGSPYYKINQTYTDASKTPVLPMVSWGGQAYDNYSRGTALSDTAVQDIVRQAIAGGLPSDVNGVYFVLTSADVSETSGFCTQYCGWHAHTSISTTDIKYAFVGNADRCPNACSVQSTSPNGNAGADAMASIIAHELEEAATDPDLNAWYDKRGYENADKCAWTFGSTYTAANGSKANMLLGGRDYLIQQNWVNSGSNVNGGYCAVKQ